MTIPNLNIISRTVRRQNARKVLVPPDHTLVVALGRTFQSEPDTPHLGQAANVVLSALPERYPSLYGPFSKALPREAGRLKDQTDLLSKVAFATGRASHTAHQLTLVKLPVVHNNAGVWVRRLGEELVARHGLSSLAHVGLVLVNADERMRLGVVATINALRPSDAWIHHPGLLSARKSWCTASAKDGARGRISIGIKAITVEEERAAHLRDPTPRSNRVFNPKLHGLAIREELRGLMEKDMVDKVHGDLQQLLKQWRVNGEETEEEKLYELRLTRKGRSKDKWGRKDKDKGMKEPVEETGERHRERDADERAAGALLYEQFRGATVGTNGRRT